MEGVRDINKNFKLPESPKYFKDIDITHELNIEQGYQKILLSRVNIKVGEISIIKTPIMVSNQGMNFTGYKLMIELICNEVIKYMPKKSNEELAIVRQNIVKNVFVTVPGEYNNRTLQDIVRLKKVIVNPYVEDVYVYEINERKAKINISVFVNCEFNI